MQRAPGGDFSGEFSYIASEIRAPKVKKCQLISDQPGSGVSIVWA